MTCWRHPDGLATCWHCLRNADVEENRRRPIPWQYQSRTRDERERAAAIVARLRPLPLWDVARYCELVLSMHLPGIEVRPERRRVPRAA